MNPKVWGKVAGIVCVGVILDIAAHQLAPQLTTSAESGTSGAIPFPPSIIARLGLFVPVFLVFALVAFGLLAAVFVYLQADLPQSRWKKGLLYGLSFGGLWYIGMLEASLVLGTPLKQELFMGFADALPIFIMGVLLGAFVGTTQNSRLRQARVSAIVIPCIAFCYCVGRYIAYISLHIQSAYTTNPLGTFLWTLVMGVWIGIIYWFLESGLKNVSAIKRAIIFGCVVYGSDCCPFAEMNWTFINYPPNEYKCQPIIRASPKFGSVNQTVA